MAIEKCYIIVSYYLQIFDRVLRERVIFGRVNWSRENFVNYDTGTKVHWKPIDRSRKRMKNDQLWIARVGIKREPVRSRLETGKRGNVFWCGKF